MYVSQTTRPEFNTIADWTIDGHNMLQNVYDGAGLTIPSVSLPWTFYGQVQQIRIALLKRAGMGGFDEENYGTSLAKEVLTYAHYGNGRHPRTNRDGVSFRIGQVVKHKVHGYTAVVIGWDRLGTAPKEWLEKVVPNPERQIEPMYALLVDTSSKNVPGKRVYIGQNELEIESSEKACQKFYHPQMAHKFTKYSINFKMWKPVRQLKKIYPLD